MGVQDFIILLSIIVIFVVIAMAVYSIVSSDITLFDEVKMDDSNLLEDAVISAYLVEWSCEDCEYVAYTDMYPSLSWLDETPVGALNGLLELIREVENDEMC